MVVAGLLRLRARFPKLRMPKELIAVYADPPASPDDCLFAKMTTCVSADLSTRITPCQFGGEPDCANCGCVASAGLGAISRHRLPGGLSVGAVFDASRRVGNVFGRVTSYRTEVLNAHLFESIAELQALTMTWLRIYNEERPHDSLGRVPPLTFLPRPTNSPRVYLQSVYLTGKLTLSVVHIGLTPHSPKKAGRSGPGRRYETPWLAISFISRSKVSISRRVS